MEYTKGEWRVCGDGDCSCKQVWSDNHPICKVTHGKWGDDYPSLVIEGSSLLPVAKPVMEQITYGEIPENVAKANALLIAAAPDYDNAIGLALWDIDNLGKVSDLTIEIMRKAKQKAEGK